MSFHPVAAGFSRPAATLLAIALWPAAAVSQNRSIADIVGIPAGVFTMGSDSGPADERPAHRIDLPAFSIDRLQVTNRQVAEFLNAVGPVNASGRRLYDFDDGDARIHKRGDRWIVDEGAEDQPAIEVSWFGAGEYCGWVGKRLPTEAEWEKAARGADLRRYPWGNAPPDRTRAQFDAGYRGIVPVGRFPAGASPYGVLDLAGNTWEWTSSAYRPYPYDQKDGRENPQDGPERVTRGGGQDSLADHITTTYRGAGLSRGPRSGHHNIGFRCAR